MDITTLADAAASVDLSALKAGLAVIGAGIGIGCIGMKAAESTGRNPASFGKVLTISILLAALIEGVAFVAIFM
ncbi:MAG: ATPase [Akkermansiaceae bacterium]|nr:ATPase [Akkermansiaceae bacterium]